MSSQQLWSEKYLQQHYENQAKETQRHDRQKSFERVVFFIATAMTGSAFLYAYYNMPWIIQEIANIQF